PNYDVDSYRAPEPNVAVSFEAIEERSQAAELVAESEVMTPNSAAPASSSPSAHSSPQIGGSAAASKPMEPMRELNQSQAKRQMGVKSENRLGGIADTARSVTQSADQFQPESAQQRSRLLSDSETTISRLTAEDIQRRLEEITALADRALLEEAQKLLDDLLEECPECTVPEALAKLKDAEFQNDSAAGFKYDQIKQ
nr:hypothetical protein [Acidiferrobacterales bacterium]